MTSGLLMRPCPPTKKNDEHALDGLHRAYQVNCLDGTHLFDAYWMGIAANIYVILSLICLVTSLCSIEQH